MGRIIPFDVSKDNTDFKIFDSLLPIHPFYLAFCHFYPSLMLYVVMAFKLEIELRTDKLEARAKEFICTV